MDPVISADGFSYERAEIEDWLARGSGSSPMTGAQLAHQHLMPNLALRSVLEIMSRNGNESLC